MRERLSPGKCPHGQAASLVKLIDVGTGVSLSLRQVARRENEPRLWASRTDSSALVQARLARNVTPSDEDKDAAPEGIPALLQSRQRLSGLAAPSSLHRSKLTQTTPGLRHSPPPPLPCSSRPSQA